MSTIEIKNLTKRYGEAEVLSNINMKLESGKIYGLVGRNGSGKTMLMKHILGFVKATQGTILINGKVVGENDDMQENIGAIIEIGFSARIFWLHKSEASCYDSGKNQR